MSSPHKFRVGDIVCLIADPSRSGSIIKILPEVGGKNRYEIFHSSQEIRQYFEDQINLIQVDQIRKFGEALVDPVEFLVRLNAIRLKNPFSDSIYALHAARIRFIPFQFKPLLKLIRAEPPRLLIADEVGVGKTIEAGLILRELESRQNISNVLIVCPKALVNKWQAEMKRFDEDFWILDGPTLKYCLHETDLEGVWPSQYSRAIVHLELLRRDEYINGNQGKRPLTGLRDLEPPPQFDLLIVDEAHHLRTPDTNTHIISRILCSNSEAIVFLSATPIQTSSANLFSLLNLLSPDTFLDMKLFEEMIEPNKYLNKAIRHIRTRQPESSWHSDTYQQLLKAGKTDWGEQALLKDPRFFSWMNRFAEENPLSDIERIQCLRDLEEVHSFATIINRTRRRDIGRFTIREPHTVTIQFNEIQQKFYDKLIEFRKEFLSLHDDPLVIKLITDILERQAESCLYGLVPLLTNFTKTGKFSQSVITDSTDLDDTDLSPQILQEADELLNIAVQLPGEDPKLDQLIQIIKATVDSSGPGKILVFSYFLHTLDYLKTNLDNRDIRVGLINGSLPDKEREYLRDRFRLPKENFRAIDVLLSSEVGCEGLDYEFCDCLVNYDIPWNPMRIEQRIGRIDRFGQKSDKVLIYNFVTVGTIAERIFFRCFERLGIFTDTLGDLEEILGELTEQLTQAVMDPELTPEQIERKAAQLADNALRELEEQRKMEEESKEIMSFDILLQSEIESIERESRFVTPEDLKTLIELYLSKRCISSKLLIDDSKDNIVRIRANKEDKGTILEDLQRLKRNDRQTVEFRRWLENTDPYLSITFNQETALENRLIPFITLIHPLTKIAANFWMDGSIDMTTCVEVKNPSHKSGIYQFAYYLWETIADRGGLILLPRVWDMSLKRVDDDLPKNLSLLLKSGTKLNVLPQIQKKDLEEGLHQIEESILKYRMSELETLRERNNQIIDMKISKLSAYYQRRISSIHEEVDKISNEKIRKMKISMQNRLEREFKEKTENLERRKIADILSQRIAHGILVIQ